MKNKGLNQHRLKDNPLEIKFANAWEKENTGRRNTLGYILAKEINHPQPEDISKRDREVAASVIQWLGSPVGRGFVREVMENTK